MRQVAIDAASIPKDAKIAALEKNSAESEKLFAEARSDKMRQFEDIQNTQVIYTNQKILKNVFFFWLLSFKNHNLFPDTVAQGPKLDRKQNIYFLNWIFF
jgi:hypothetical protein